jgi:hypothetical protein
MKEYFIVNSFDRPCEGMIAFEQPDGRLAYAGWLPRLREYDGMDASHATPLEDFGLDIDIQNGWLVGRVVRKSTALYPDGSPRPWQGSEKFSVLLRKEAQ